MNWNTKKRSFYGTVVGTALFAITYYFSIQTNKGSNNLTNFLNYLTIDENIIQHSNLIFFLAWTAFVFITIIVLPYFIKLLPYVLRFIVKAFKLLIKILKLNKLHKLHDQGAISKKDYLEMLAVIKKT